MIGLDPLRHPFLAVAARWDPRHANEPRELPGYLSTRGRLPDDVSRPVPPADPRMQGVSLWITR